MTYMVGGVFVLVMTNVQMLNYTVYKSVYKKSNG